MADFYYSEFAAAQRVIRDAVVIHAQAITAPLPGRLTRYRWSIDNRGYFGMRAINGAQHSSGGGDTRYRNDHRRGFWKAC